MSPRPALVAAALVVAAAGCERKAGTCDSDAQCDPTAQGYARCDVEGGLCLCIDDRACGPNEKCNASGRCQAQSGCLSNDDCDEGLFCNIVEGECEADQVCGSDRRCCATDAACGFGTVCDLLTLACIDGCRDDADCPLGQGCIAGGFGRLGVCGTSCTADNLCGFGELCNLTTGACETDARGPYCFGCSGGTASDDCGAFGNYCLSDTVNGGSYCGVECAGGQACPNGYDCRDVIILPRATLPFCTLPEDCVDNRCARTGAACVEPEDCPEGPPGSDCPRADVGNCELDVNRPCSRDDECDGVGACLKQQCREREGAAVGICTCTRDSDCPRDRCFDADLTDPDGPIAGHCELSQHACFEDIDCDVITCTLGGCRIGKNCKPAGDRTCVDVLD